MMPLTTAVLTTARVTRSIRPALLSFLETRHCRRMSVGKQKSSRPHDSRPNLRPWSPLVVSLPVERPRRGISQAEKEMSKKDSRKPPSAMGPEGKRPVVNPRPSSQVFSSPSPADQVKQAVTPPSRRTNASPVAMDDQIPTAELERYDDEEPEYVEVFKQAPNPPLPRFACNFYPSAEGISGRAAAIAYLRIRGLANRGRKKTFYTLLAWILCHAARELGFEIVPDGFVRISDLLRFEFFQKYTLESFAKACISDIYDRFEVVSLPDLVDGEMREVWWARSRASQTIPGVNASHKRIINMGKLQTVIYRAPFADWPMIQRHGILAGPDRIIRLYESGSTYFRNLIPRNSKLICITIDAQRAAELGVMFFHTIDVELLAVGRRGAIPAAAVRSVVEVEVSKEDLI